MNLYLSSSLIFWVLGALFLSYFFGRYYAKAVEEHTAGFVVFVVFWPILICSLPFFYLYDVGEQKATRIKNDTTKK